MKIDKEWTNKFNDDRRYYINANKDEIGRTHIYGKNYYILTYHVQGTVWYDPIDGAPEQQTDDERYVEWDVVKCHDGTEMFIKDSIVVYTI